MGLSSLRRYEPLAGGRGTVIPLDVRRDVIGRDVACVGSQVGFPIEGPHRLDGELDHVRASHGMGMKSPSTADNLVLLCAECHRWKTEHGREAGPLLLAYLSRVSR